MPSPYLIPVEARRIAERLNPADFNVNVVVGRTGAARREGTGEGSVADGDAESELARLVVKTGTLKAAQGEVESVVEAVLSGLEDEDAQLILTQPIRDKADGIVSDLATAAMRLAPTSKSALDRGGDEDARAMQKDARARLVAFKADLLVAATLFIPPTTPADFSVSGIAPKSRRVRVCLI